MSQSNNNRKVCDFEVGQPIVAASQISSGSGDFVARSLLTSGSVLRSHRLFKPAQLTSLFSFNGARLTRALAVALLATLALAQDGDVAQIGSSDVLRVGAHIACKCGSCKDTVACPMALQGCGFCNPARVKIAKMQLAGMKDKEVVDSFVKEYGADIYRADPNSFFWMIPYGALGLGLLAIFFFLRQSFRPKPAQPASTAPAPEVEVDPRYLAAAEKETSSLDQ